MKITFRVVTHDTERAEKMYNFLKGAGVHGLSIADGHVLHASVSLEAADAALAAFKNVASEYPWEN
jgi:hypothetical protein